MIVGVCHRFLTELTQIYVSDANFGMEKVWPRNEHLWSRGTNILEDSLELCNLGGKKRAVRVTIVQLY